MVPPVGRGSGSVRSLWRYPVKSMAGESLDGSAVTAHGLLGDRALALMDVTDGRVASAKNPRKWPRIFDFSANFVEAPSAAGALPNVRITMPDGTSVETGQADVDGVLSAALGRDVRVHGPLGPHAGAARWRATAEEYLPGDEASDAPAEVVDFELPEGSFVDCAAVHVLTTSTLARLEELYPEGRMAVPRFRPNIVIDTGAGGGFLEDGWVGATLHVGDQVRLRIDGPCGRCVMVTLPQGDLPKDRGVLRTAALHNDTQVGVYASVVRGGYVRRGDSTVVR